MLCKEHKVGMKSVPIVKYESKRVFGTNYFCRKRGCNYEVDTNERD